MKNNIGNIPTEIKSAVYVGKGFFLSDLAFILIYSMIIMDQLKYLVSPKLQSVYMIFNVIVAVILTRPINAKNPQKKIYQALLIYFLSKRNQAYYYIEPEEKGEVLADEEIY